MPRGRPSTVRYFLDSITGNVVALGSGMMRVLQEIGGSGKATRKKRAGRGPGRPKKVVAAVAKKKSRGRRKKESAAKAE